ncbi:unnamed protein product [Ceratitis capitata]|uniref:(Mediterranean fruit fly) hypothetical protein n=1 Tax=Ceratitis capitata TaxID=7213 RepID=A0A811UCP7_CERCA|nr:unnamed protein product [Ceratitis capitata]
MELVLSDSRMGCRGLYQTICEASQFPGLEIYVRSYRRIYQKSSRSSARESSLKFWTPPENATTKAAQVTGALSKLMGNANG